MKDLLAERARVRGGKKNDDGSETPVERAPKKSTGGASASPKERDLSALAQSVKRKMESSGGTNGAAKSGRKRSRK